MGGLNNDLIDLRLSTVSLGWRRPGRSLEMTHSIASDAAAEEEEEEERRRSCWWKLLLL